MTYIHIAKVKGLSVDDFRQVNEKMVAPADTDGLLVTAAGARVPSPYACLDVLPYHSLP